MLFIQISLKLVPLGLIDSKLTLVQLMACWCHVWELYLIEAETNGRHFADDIFNSIFLNENVWTPITISLKFVPKGLSNNIPALVQIMAWRRPGDKPLSEPMMVSLLTHICVIQPQWVNASSGGFKTIKFKIWIFQRWLNLIKVL